MPIFLGFTFIEEERRGGRERGRGGGGVRAAGLKLHSTRMS